MIHENERKHTHKYWPQKRKKILMNYSIDIEWGERNERRKKYTTKKNMTKIINDDDGDNQKQLIEYIFV